MGTTQYHLNYLTKSEKITSVRRGLRKFYFLFGIFYGTNGCNILQVLSQETARDILLFIITRKNPTQTDLIRLTGITASSMNWHISRLLELNLIHESRSGKYKRYRLAADPNIIIEIIRNYRPGIWDRWNGRLTEVVLFLSGEDRNDTQ
jgi:predicted transcriptional regulator